MRYFECQSTCLHSARLYNSLSKRIEFVVSVCKSILVKIAHLKSLPYGSKEVRLLLCSCPLGGALSDDTVMSDVCLSVAYIGPKSRTARPRKTKIATEVAHITRDSDTTFKVKRSKVKVTGTGAYCGGLPYSLL